MLAAFVPGVLEARLRAGLPPSTGYTIVVPDVFRAEIDKVASGQWPLDDNPLVNAPHTAASLAREWNHAYSREEGAYPMGTGVAKVWPPVRRIDGARGDRNLVCSCPPLSAYQD